MGKLIFWLVVLFFAGLFFLLKVRLRPPAGRRDEKNGRRSSKTLQSVRCRECGVFVPEDQAVRRAGEDFCSWEHAEKWHQRQH